MMDTSCRNDDTFSPLCWFLNDYIAHPLMQNDRPSIVAYSSGWIAINSASTRRRCHHLSAGHYCSKYYQNMKWQLLPSYYSNVNATGNPHINVLCRWRHWTGCLGMLPMYDKLSWKKSLMALITACGDGEKRRNKVGTRLTGTKSQRQSLTIVMLGCWKGAGPWGGP